MLVVETVARIRREFFVKGKDYEDYGDSGLRGLRWDYGDSALNWPWDAVSRLAGLRIDLAGTGDDQIIGAVGGTGTAIGYNPASQIASITRSNVNYAWNGSYNVNRGYTTNGLNQHTVAGSVSFGYDARGNLTTSGSASYSYSKLNLMTGSPAATLYYDSLGRLHEYDTTVSTRGLR